MKIFLENLKNRFSSEKFSVGLDIGTSEIKFAKFKAEKDGLKAIALAAEPLQPDLASALGKVAKEQGIKEAGISISGSSAIIRHVSLPRMTKEELTQALRFEAEKHIPFPISEVNVDAHILKSDPKDNKMLVLIAAVKKDFLNQRLKALEQAGIKVMSVDIDSLALINAFNFNYPETDKTKTIALLNIGASLSNLSILEGTIPYLSRDIQIAGGNLTQKISEVLNIDLKAAENLKINPQNDQLDKITVVSETVFSQLAAEIRTSFDYYESQNASSVGKIFLSGGCSLLAGLKTSLANLLGIEVDQWNPFKQVVPVEGLDLSQIGPRQAKFAVAVGLALK